MTSILILKLILAITITVTLAEVSKRVSPLAGGILTALPLGTALSMYFIAYEQGVNFAISGISSGIAGLAGALVFCYAYVLVVRLWERGRLRSQSFWHRLPVIAVAALASIAAFLIMGYGIHEIHVNLWTSTLVMAVSFVVLVPMLKKIALLDNPVGKSKSSLLQMLIRGTVAGGILLLVTGIASAVGSEWAGVLSSFPLTLFSLVIVLHAEAGSELFPRVIYGYCANIMTLVVFYYGFLLLVPKFSLNLGFMIDYFICTVYLLGMQWLLRRRVRRAHVPNV